MSGEMNINQTLAELCGVKPVLEEWWVTNPEENSIVMGSPHKQECERWLESLPSGSPYRGWHVKPFYRYPDYAGDLNVVHRVVKDLRFSQRREYRRRLQGVCSAGLPDGMSVTTEECIDATAEQRARALVDTLTALPVN